MAEKSLSNIIAEYPSRVEFEEITDFNKFDDRRSCIECVTVNIIGVNDGFIEFCPNEEPPEMLELLSWIWLFRPDLGNEIMKNAPEELNKLIEHYNSNQLDEWWKYMNE